MPPGGAAPVLADAGVEVQCTAMGDVINLNRFRKGRDKAAKAQDADANRRKFGRTKAEKAAEDGEEARRKALLDGAKREE
ncbi:DUF4169 family protein [Sphingomonas panni]